MKILHVAVFTANSTNVWQAAGFEKLGHPVVRYDYRAKAKELGVANRDNDLITLCKKERPDIILFSKCNSMNANVVKECRSVGTTVLWYMDGLNNMDNELREKVKESDYVFCSVKKCVDKMSMYCDNSYRLHGGYDPEIHKPINVPKIRDVAFIGDLRTYRKPFRDFYSFDVITGVYNHAHSKAVSETKINLSFTVPIGISNRIFKLLASKGFVLTMPWETMSEDFEPGKDFDVFKSPEEMVEKIEYYLKHDEERERIAEHGYNTVKKYDNVNYAKQIIRRVTNE